MAHRVSNDLNDSSDVNEFLKDEAKGSVLADQRKSRQKSAYETFRDSSNFID